MSQDRWRLGLDGDLRAVLFFGAVFWLTVFAVIALWP